MNKKHNILLINTFSKKIEFAYNKKGDFCILKELDESKNADDLVLEIKTKFDEQGLCFQEIDYVGFVNGPGSYTGLRVGSAIAKAICFATGSELVEVHTLDLISYKYYENYPTEESNVIPLVFSNMKTEEFYFAVYKDKIRVTDYGVAVLKDIEKYEGITVTNEKNRFSFPVGIRVCDLSDKSDIHSLYKLIFGLVSENKVSDFRTSEPYYMKHFFGD